MMRRESVEVEKRGSLLIRYAPSSMTTISYIYSSYSDVYMGFVLGTLTELIASEYSINHCLALTYRCSYLWKITCGKYQSMLTHY